jgi:ATP/ADP translocase
LKLNWLPKRLNELKGGTSMASRMFALVLVLFSYLFFPSKILSTPYPFEVEKIKAAAPMHVIATVSSDGLHKD